MSDDVRGSIPIDDVRGRLTRRTLLRRVGIGAAATMALPLLAAACAPGASPAPSKPAGTSAGGAASGAKNQTLTILVGKDANAAEGQQRVYDAIKDRFESEFPTNTVRVDYTTLGAGVTTALTTAAASHEGPDVFEVGPTLLPTGQAAQAFEVLSDDAWARIGGKAKFVPSTISGAGQTQDQLVAVPAFVSTMGTFYNTKLFDAAGVKPPTSWNDFVTAGKALTSASENRFGVGMAPGEPPHTWHALWVMTTQRGGRFVTDKGEANLESPQLVDSATFWLDWIVQHKIASPDDVTHGWADQVTQFAQRKSAMFPFGWQSTLASLAGSAVDGEWAVAGNPTIPFGMQDLPAGGKPAQTFLGGNLWAIFRYSKNKDLAIELARIMSSPDIQYMYWKELGGLPVTTETYTAHPDAKQGPWAAMYQAAQSAEPLPWSPAFSQVSPLLSAALKPSFAEIASTGAYSVPNLKAQLAAANQKFSAALKGAG